MLSRLLTIICAALLTLVFVVPAPAFAGPVHYGTGIYLWVLTCPTGPSSWTVQYVSSSTCPNNAPSNCTCKLTNHDFPVDHPYATRAVLSGGGEDGDGNPGVVDVMFDQVGAIQCGVTVAPPREGHGTCGDHFSVEAVDEWEVDLGLVRAVEALRDDIEAETGHPVERFTYGFAKAN